MALYIIGLSEVSEHKPVQAIITKEGKIELDLGITPKPPVGAVEACVSLDGVILILLDPSADSKVVQEVERIGTNQNWHFTTQYYKVDCDNHYEGLMKLGTIGVNVWIRRSDIGKANAHKLVQMNTAILLEQ